MLFLSQTILLEFLKSINLDNYGILLALIIVVFSFILNRVILWLMNKSFITASEKLKVDPTRYKFFKNAVTFIIWMIAIAAIVLLIPKLKTLAIALFAGAGVFLAIVGFAAQQAFSNIISGIFVIIFKPFRVGDVIKVGSNHIGEVEDITLRHTIITDWENKRIIIPNSVISSETIINSSIEDEKVCEFVIFGISYDSDVDKAIEIIRDQAESHRNCVDNRTEKEKSKGALKVPVYVIGFGDSSVNLRANVWCDNFIKARELHFDLNKSIKKRFDEEGIEIPFPYRTIVFKDKQGKISNTDEETT